MTTSSKPTALKTLLRLLPPAAGLVCVIAALTASVLTSQFTPGLAALAIVGVVLFLTLFLTGEGGNLLQYLHLATYTALVGGCLVLLYMLAANHPKKWDLTADQQHSLSPQTLRFVERLGQPVRILAFAGSEDIAEVESFLSLYSAANPARVTIEVRNPDSDPVFLKSFGENIFAGDYFVIAKEANGEERRKKVSLGAFPKDRESQLTNAMLGVLRDREMKVYFLSGHGERLLSAPANAASRGEDESLSTLVTLLGERGYPSDSLNLLERGSIPDDAAMIVLAGPQQDLFEIEAEIVREYLREGGRLLALVDPIVRRNGDLPNVRGVLRDWGIDTPPNSMVADLVAARTPLGVTSPIVQEFGNHQIVEGLPTGSFYLQEARPLGRSAPPPEGVMVTELFKTGPSCWAEDMDTLLARGKYEVPDSPGGAIGLAMAASKSSAGARGDLRVVAVGDSDVFTNKGIGDLSATFLLQSVNWLAQSDDLLSIPPKLIRETPLVVTRPRFLAVTLGLGLLVLVVMFGGLAYTVVRKKLG